MERRRFLAYLCGAPVVGYATVKLLSSGEAFAADPASSCQSFGYYEPLGETDPHNADETDGTTYNMPCISGDDIAAAKDKTYKFWHGHDGQDHMFTVTADDFRQLAQGKSLLLYTTMVEGHRHPLQITPSSQCEQS